MVVPTSAAFSTCSIRSSRRGRLPRRPIRLVKSSAIYQLNAGRVAVGTIDLASRSRSVTGDENWRKHHQSRQHRLRR